MKQLSIPMPFGGRMHIAFERNGAIHRSGMAFGTNLEAALFHRGKYQGKKNLGSGLVTNVGVLALANDMNWASPSAAAINLFKLLKYHQTGTGTTAAAMTDIKLQTISAQGGQTPVAGTQVFTPAANLQKIVSVATISYTGTEAVTEWLFTNSSALTATTGTPFTAGTATTGTVTGTPYTASSTTLQGQQQFVFEDTTATSWGLVLSNTNAVVTVPAWYKVSDGTVGTTPANTDALVIRGVAWDHKVFSAINVNNGDSIQFTYTLTISAGG